MVVCKKRPSNFLHSNKVVNKSYSLKNLPKSVISLMGEASPKTGKFSTTKNTLTIGKSDYYLPDSLGKTLKTNKFRLTTHATPKNKTERNLHSKLKNYYETSHEDSFFLRNKEISMIADTSQSVV